MQGTACSTRGGHFEPMPDTLDGLSPPNVKLLGLERGVIATVDRTDLIALVVGLTRGATPQANE